MFIKTHIAISLISLSIIEFVHNTAVSKPISYVLSCGNTGTVDDANHRKWSPDDRFLSSPGNSTTATAQSQDPSLPSTIPYMTARIFTSPNSYNFSVSPRDRHWVRLHFYPSSSYSSFKVADSHFSVTLNGFTLMNNFSASITAQALTQAYIVREFTLIPAKSGFLNLTFIPSSSSMAFINGIEVIPMPDIFQTSPMVGFSHHPISPENATLQTMYRLNVGGQFIPANNDSGGLSRTWYDDSPYLFGAALGMTSEAEKNFTIRYPASLPEHIAPVDVYRTARSMGPNPKVNLNYNLTWVFQVDANFTYLVRLHFCDFLFSKPNQRVFDIFINNQTAQANGDVIAWSHSKGVPVYKDFAVYFKGGGDGDLWVALHPAEPMKPEFMDAILNGMEIFKINDTSGNLAGPNPEISRMQQKASDQEARAFLESDSSDFPRVIGGITGGLVGICLVIGLFLLLKSKKRRLAAPPGRNRKPSGWLPLSGGISHSDSAGSNRFNLSGGLCRHFSLAEIKSATNNFDESQVIGVGGFGKVYRGNFEGGGSKVAIKRSNPSSEQGLHEFQTEIELLSKLRHKHLVSLIGACDQGDEMILVYDYMANGTLREHLYKTDNPPLKWKQRLEICIGAARGLHYLHTGAKYTIIHRDVKTTNILLDEKWVAKVSDFGLSKTGPALNQTHVSTMVKGSFGYLDPEYFRRQQLTDKSDVYSFGVVLFEVLCARPAISPSLPKEEVCLADWALRRFRDGKIDKIIDRNIKDEINRECLNKFVEIAVKCLADQGINRPSMGNVLWNLEYAMQLLDNPQKIDEAFVTQATLLSIKEDGEETEDSSNEIFSQIVKPRGR